MGLHPQQRAGLVRGGRGPLGQPREADSTRDQLHVGLDRLALGVADGVLHADPQVTAGRQARQDHRDRRAADAGGREGGARRQVAQAGDQRFGGTGHAAGYTQAEVEGRLGGVVADVDVDHAGADRLALTGRGDEFVEGDRKGGYVRLGGLRTGRCHRDQRRCRHGRDPATTAFSPASGLGLVRTDKSLYGFCMGRRRWISVLAGAVLVAGAVGFVAWPAQAAGGVTATFSKDSDWGSGDQAKDTITNGGTAAISAWTVAFDLPSGLTLGSYWDATATTSGQHVTARNREYNGSIAPGASASFGFLVGGGSGVPTGCTVNGGG